VPRGGLGEIARDHKIAPAGTYKFGICEDDLVITQLTKNCEPLVASSTVEHPFSVRAALDWASLADETILVQTWAESEEQRAFFDARLGRGARFQSHAASKQVMPGIMITCRSQSMTIVPGIISMPIDEPNAWVRVHLARMPEAVAPVVGRFVALARDAAPMRCLA
jgi:hypothetical protein